MQPVANSLHAYYLRFNQHYYNNADYYASGEELISIVKKYTSQDTHISRNDIWTMVNYKDVFDSIPIQGWKIHASATYINHKEILEIVSEYCINRKIPFKFTCDSQMFLVINNKAMARGASGKFITIYPKNKDEFKVILEELYQKLKHYEGPYILSDRRYKDCKVLYYRYGTMKNRNYLNYRGERVSYLLSPDNRIVPDLRNSYFSLPDWETDDLYIEDENNSSEDILLNNRYLISTALNFSNTGGVYKAKDTWNNNVDVVIKEARRHTGLDIKGNDAVHRLKNEYDKLLKAKDSGVTPQVVDYFTEWEHEFLVEEFVDGTVLTDFIFKKNPLIRDNPGTELVREYCEKIPQLWLKLAKGFKKIFEKDICINDVSFHNIIINNEETMKLTFIDFEGSYYASSEQPYDLGTPGFRIGYNERLNPFENELKKLGYIYLSSIFPLNNILELSKNKAFDIINHLKIHLPIPSYMYDLVEDIISGNINTVDKVIEILEKNNSNNIIHFQESNFDEINEDFNYEKIKQKISIIEEAIFQSMNSNDDSRLFPSDPVVFMTNPLNVAYGSYGVLYALGKNHTNSPYKHLFSKAMGWNLLKSIDHDNYTGGLFVGTSGISWVLTSLGYLEEGKRVLDLGNIHPKLNESADIFYGTAGNGLANLYFYKKTNDEKYLDIAIERAEDIIKKSKNDEQGNIFWEDIHGDIYYGYGSGSSGISLFLLYMYLETNNEKYLNYGIKGLNHDLFHVFVNEDGVLALNRGSKKENSHVQSPYIYDGITGLGTTLLRYNLIVNNPEYSKVINSIIRDSKNRIITVFPGYMRGLSGIANFMLDYLEVTNDHSIIPSINKILTSLDLFFVKDNNVSGFAGEQLFRISHDYSTGSSGVLLLYKRILTCLNGSLNNNNFFLDEFYFKNINLKKKEKAQNQLITT